jgi:hypothetical protein
VDYSGNLSTDWVRSLIGEFISGSPLNNLGDQTGEPAWDDVLIGFASGADPIWPQYKEYIGPFHWTPWEVYHQHCPGDPAGAAELTVLGLAPAEGGSPGQSPVSKVSVRSLGPGQDLWRGVQCRPAPPPD